MRIAGREVVTHYATTQGFIARECITREELEEAIDKGSTPTELAAEIERRIAQIPGIMLGVNSLNPQLGATGVIGRKFTVSRFMEHSHPYISVQKRADRINPPTSLNGLLTRVKRSGANVPEATCFWGGQKPSANR
jgi:hypothetical protein